MEVFEQLDSVPIVLVLADPEEGHNKIDIDGKKNDFEHKIMKDAQSGLTLGCLVWIAAGKTIKVSCPQTRRWATIKAVFNVRRGGVTIETSDGPGVEKEGDFLLHLSGEYLPKWANPSVLTFHVNNETMEPSW